MPAAGRARALVAAVIAVVSILAVPWSTLGHTILVRTDPPDGVVLDHAPRTLDLWFTEALLPDRSTFRLIDGDGRSVATEATSPVDGDHARVRLTLPALAASTFRLAWRTVSEDDLHTASGTMVFGVAAGPAGESTVAGTSARPDAVVIGWLGLAAYAGLLGAFAIALLLRSAPPSRAAGRAGASDRTRRRLLALAIAASTIGVVAGVASLISDSLRMGRTDGGPGLDLSIALGTGHGIRVVASVAIFAVVAGAGAWQWRSTERDDVAASRRRSRFGEFMWPAIGVVALVALAAFRVLNGHTGAALPWTATIASIIHTLAASLWVGGLAVLGLTVVPLLAREPASRTFAIGVLQRFGRVAASALAIVLITGLIVGGELVASVDALLFTDYGHVLLIKIGLALLVAGVGLANNTTLHRSILHRRPSRRTTTVSPRGEGAGIGAHRLRDRLRRSVPLEAAGAMLVVLMASLLAATPPATNAGGPRVAASSPIVEPASGRAEDLLVSVVIRPARPGRNFVDVSVFDTRRPAPAPVDAVVVRLVPPANPGAGSAIIERVLAPLGDGQYEAALDLPDDVGRWQVSVDTTRRSMPVAGFVTPWTVAADANAIDRQGIVSNQPLRPVLDAAAALIGIGLAAIVLGRWLWRSHGSASLRQTTRTRRAIVSSGRVDP